MERSNDLSSPKIALLIDFDNVILGIDDPGFDVQLVVNALRERGQIVLGRCYGDWYRHNRHRRNLMEQGLELVETPAFGPVIKNSADIRIALDGYEIGMTQHHIDTFCIVSGDSDFLPLIKKLQFLGKKVLVICGSRFTSDMVRRNCNEFISYENLLAASVGATEDATTLDGAFALLDRAMTALREAGRDIRTSTLKQMMLQLNPVFSERSFGCSQFRFFLDKAVARKLIKYGPRDRTSGEFHVLLHDEDEAPLVEKFEARTRNRETARPDKMESKGETEQIAPVAADASPTEAPKSAKPVGAKTDEESPYPRYDRSARRNERRYSREVPAKTLQTSPPTQNAEVIDETDAETTPVIAALDHISSDAPTAEDLTDNLLTPTELVARGLRRGKLKFSARTGKTEVLSTLTESKPVESQFQSPEVTQVAIESIDEVVSSESVESQRSEVVDAEMAPDTIATEDKPKKRPARRRAPRKKATEVQAETNLAEPATDAGSTEAEAAPEVVSPVAEPVEAPTTVEISPQAAAAIETPAVTPEEEAPAKERPKKKAAPRRRTTKKKVEEAA